MANVVRLGPYVAGEIPPPFTYTFLDDAGDPVPLDGFEAKLVWKRRSTIVTRDAEVDADQSTNPGQVTYAWVEADMENAGTYNADLWVGNGTNRLASVRLTWQVARAVGPVPEI